MATETEILRCHSNELLELIKMSVSMTEDQLAELSTRFDSVYIHRVCYLHVYVLALFYCHVFDITLLSDQVAHFSIIQQ